MQRIIGTVHGLLRRDHVLYWGGTKVEDEEEKDEIGFMHRELTDEEKTENAKWQQRAESDMLKKLK